MAKRFTDTDKWKKAFLRKLPLKYKLFWLYLLDDCNHAGIWEVDLEVASIKIGLQLDEADTLKHFEKKIVVIDDGNKWFIPSFIEFQYGELKQSNRPHASVINELIKHNLIDAIDYKYAYKISSGIGEKKKQKLFVRDNFTCIYCNMQYDPAFLSHDHVIPRADGGTHDMGNLVTACTKCNKEKSSFSVEEFCERTNKDVVAVLERLKTATNTPTEAPPKTPSRRVKDKDKDKDKDILFVLKYLNDRANKKFKPVESNLKPIRARLAEGYTVEQCMTVIDTKRQDPHFKSNPQFLRPQTLFGNKFDVYLNEKPQDYQRGQSTPPKKDVSDIWKGEQ